MAGDEHKLFRTKALERLSTPDRLDEQIQVVGPSEWLPIATMAGLLLLALAWSIVGRVPTSVSGRGVLIHPRSVLDVQSLGAGRLERLSIRAGDRVTEGQVIGVVDQVELRRRIAEDQALLAQLVQQGQQQTQAQRAEARRAQQQTGLVKDYTRVQADAYRKTLADAQALQPMIDRRLASLRTLRDRGLLASAAPELLEAEQASLDNARRITDVAAGLRDLDVRLAESEGAETSLTRQHLDADAARQAEVRRLEAAIAISRVQIDQHSQIVAPASGRVLELLTAPGQVVAAGAPVATMAVDDPRATLVAVAYLALGDGKRVQPGMRVLVTPDTVERQRYGGITGTVTAVSDLPVTADGVRALVGGAELARDLLANGARLEITATLDRSTATASGYAWSSSQGPATPVTAGVTSDVRIVVEERAPITYVMPFLRELTGTR